MKQLEAAGADFIVLPCNTLHSLLPKLRESSKLPVLDLIEEVSAHIRKNHKAIGILSTSKTRQDRLYDKQLSGIKILYPEEDEQREISEIILRIIKIKATERDKHFLERIIEDLVNQGAEKVLLACTDLANLVKDNPHTIDSTDILIGAVEGRMGDGTKRKG